MAPSLVFVHFPRWHWHGKDQSSVGTQDPIDLAQRSAVVCHVLKNLEEQHCVNTSVTKRQAINRRSEEHTSELQSRLHLVCRLLLEKKKILTSSSGPCPFPLAH